MDHEWNKIVLELRQQYKWKCFIIDMIVSTIFTIIMIILIGGIIYSLI